ncbi:DUF6327 family protein [Zeaxanthinibacter sp. PT1]|uniref:DUF6327 family protein n=1 Tax=Zeaxanthinibacter TaxID=561554 RepID=UPI002349A277|nr:DUF6327 family protein [Zeaxanthinibacter sp. PT1]MDC6352091.1 DUF6327 family protein [Zeaxanthinibacter sp. PT1]
MKRSYSSLDEIDEHLQVLKLKRDIYRERIKLQLNKTKNNFVPNIKSDLLQMLKMMLVTLAIKNITAKLLRSPAQSKEKNPLHKRAAS